MRTTLFREYDITVRNGMMYMRQDLRPIDEQKTACPVGPRSDVPGEKDSQQLELFESNQFHRKPRRPRNRRRQ